MRLKVIFCLKLSLFFSLLTGGTTLLADEALKLRAQDGTVINVVYHSWSVEMSEGNQFHGGCKYAVIDEIVVIPNFNYSYGGGITLHQRLFPLKCKDGVCLLNKDFASWEPYELMLSCAGPGFDPRLEQKIIYRLKIAIDSSAYEGQKERHLLYDPITKSNYFGLMF